MKILALETSTQLGSVCLLENDTVISFKKSENQKAHSDFLHSAIEEVLLESSLKIKDIDLFATGLGPGSFTGIRIAANAVKTYSYLTKKPCLGINSLELLANQLTEQNLPVLTLINAYKNMNYTGFFIFKNGAWTEVRKPEAVGVKNLSEWLAASEETRNLDSFYVVGDGHKTYLPFYEPEVLKKMIRPNNPQDFPSAKTLGHLSFTKAKSRWTMDWNSILPLYIRASEAEETKRGLIFSPLK